MIPALLISLTVALLLAARASLIDRRIAREAAALVPVVPALCVAKVQIATKWRRSRRSTKR